MAAIETAASMIQNREPSGKVGPGPAPAHRRGRSRVPYEVNGARVAKPLRGQCCSSTNEKNGVAALSLVN